MWDAARAMLKGKCIAFSTYKKRKKSKISDLKFYSKKLKKEKNRMKKIVEIIKMCIRINEIKSQTRKKITKAQILFFEKINKIDKLLSRPIKK